MIFVPQNPYDVKQAREYLEALIKKGDPFEVKRKAPKRTGRQNSYLHVILGFFASEYGCSLEEAKIDFFKRECNREIFEREGVNKQGKSVTYLRSSKDLSTAEMALATDRFRHWSASVAEIYLPAPNEEQFLAYCEKIIEQNQEFV